MRTTCLVEKAGCRDSLKGMGLDETVIDTVPSGSVIVLSSSVIGDLSQRRYENRRAENILFPSRV
jgi:hypothetical protein